MIVPITSADGKATKDYVLVELQGRVESLTGEETKEIGVLLSADQEGKTLQLTIGYHQLEGKRTLLKKPLAILGKSVGAVATGGGTSYEVLGVIRSSYLFKTRPRALISKPGSVPAR
ncbi:Chromosome transmission fidelity protein 8 [Tetrabaena socialis]|uniref:Chromosome transmission fidelity protein 8 n=1 Tax=Tetrabaena socialis TaxID=47790 RepID=A0A2J8ACL1_9CHLO|nr:Chromosome transmission fidelity protein 8 [Tetrabaena socialis]|eukprot:PNH10246.1 Chromosome transmission fidelity protein 8 [Tetrabaena socialis]